MKQLILTFALTLVVLCTNAQWWNEKTRDAAYEAPNSLLCKKWISSNNNNQTFIYSANGTFKFTEKSIDNASGVGFTTEISGKYVRNKDVLTLTFSSASCVADPTGLAKLSARRRDEIISNLRQFSMKLTNEMKNERKYMLLLRLDDEYLIEAPYDPQSKIFNDSKSAIDVFYNETHEKKLLAASPEFPGGMEALMKFLSENVCYPEEAYKAGIQGRVVVSFIIEPDGSISNVQVVQGVNDSLDAEAVRVVRTMPKWTPGMEGGEAVRVKYNLPITFSK